MVQGRIVCLALLTVQNASVSLLTRHSLVSTSSQQRYSPPVAVLTTELVKALISAVMLVWSTRPGTPRHVTRQLRRVFATSAVVDMTVPAALYSVQNRLLYVALSNLSAAVFQTTYQLKLVTTALFSCWFLEPTPSASLSIPKLVSLALLTFGIAIVQLGNRNRDSSPSLALEEKRAARGLAAIVVACVSSGFAGVWFERVLKLSSSRARRDQREPVSIWVRNLQLSVPSIAFASIAVYSSSPHVRGLWSGFTPLVWAVVMNQAIGGLLVSLVVKKASSVDKGFATSIAIVLSTFLNWLLDLDRLDKVESGRRTGPGIEFAFGATLVIGSTVLYTLCDKQRGSDIEKDGAKRDGGDGPEYVTGMKKDRASSPTRQKKD